MLFPHFSHVETDGQKRVLPGHTALTEKMDAAPVSCPMYYIGGESQSLPPCKNK